MKILESLKRILNLSGAEIRVVSEKSVFFQSDNIIGEVIITAPEYELTGNSIKLQLKEYWIFNPKPGEYTQPVTEYKTRTEIILEQSFAFEPKTEHKYPFEIQLPMNCRITSGGAGWCLDITMDIPQAIDPFKSFIVSVHPAKEFLAIITAFEKVVKLQEDKNSRHWKYLSKRTLFRLLPPQEHRSKLDYLAFELVQTEKSGVSGKIKFNLEEKTTIDYLKKLIGANKVENRFELTASQIFLPDGNINEKEILNAIVKQFK